MDAKQQETVVSVRPEVTKEEINKVIRHHVWSAMGVALVPLPVVDYVALTGIQMNLLRRLAKMYEVPFLQDKVKNIISPLVGAAMPGIFGVPLAVSLIKFVPLIGQSVGMLSMPIIAGASTYALGKVFLQHFASGGTFLTFNPEKVKAYYAEMFKEGQQVAAEMKG